VYGNFSAREVQYADLVRALSAFKDDFASIWVVTTWTWRPSSRRPVSAR
jgi:hypothetical protein